LLFEETVAITGNIRALAFTAPGCSQPVFVISRVTFDYEPLLRFANEQGNVARYVYIEHSWEKPDRLGFFVTRMKYAALATFGLTRYAPSGYLLLIASPPQCDLADAYNWRNVWDRDFVAAAAGTR